MTATSTAKSSRHKGHCMDGLAKSSVAERIPLVLRCALLLLAPLLVHSGEPRQVDGVFLADFDRQSESDEYTRYELLAPESASFRIYYEVTATTGGARFFYNPIRKGSEASEESVRDAMTGEPLEFEVVSGADARKDALMSGADTDVNYIKVRLARPVPAHGRGRVIISKTYRDPKSYHMDGSALIFDRPLGIARNKVVLPLGYEVVGLSVPSQLHTESDGRIAVSFMHAGTGGAPLVIRAVKDAQIGNAALPRPASEKRSWESPFSGETEAERLAERAYQDREIVYFLQQPESHAFALYHDYTETRVGINAYANVVRSGSTASKPSAMILDTGETLKPSEMSGAELTKSKLSVGETVPPESRVVVIPFAAIKDRQSVRLRITETYTAPVSYRLEEDELVFDRSLGRPRNAVVLPTGWYCTASSIPGTVSQLPDGRIRIDYWDDRPDPVDVLLKARRRKAAQ